MRNKFNIKKIMYLAASFHESEDGKILYYKFRLLLFFFINNLIFNA